MTVAMLFSLSFTGYSNPVLLQEENNYEPHSGQSIFDLINNQEIVEMTLVGELDSLISVRNTHKYSKAALTYKDEMGIDRQYEVKVKPRGKFRRRVCDFPPLKLKFSKDQLEAAGLVKHNDLKLVTHCMDSPTYNEKLILKEYLAYQMYNELTPNSLRVQLVKITYQDKHDKRHKIKQYGFLIEDVDEMADRIKGKECDNCMGVPKDKIKKSHENIMAMFQYMIGNADYDINMNRNVKMIELADGNFIPVPYDFDFTMFVGPPYLKPNAQVKQTGNMERIFMGYTTDSSSLTGTISYFKTKKDALLNIIRDFKFLEEEEKERVSSYINSFYNQFEDKSGVGEIIFAHEANQLR